MMPLSIANVAHIGSLDVYSGSLLMVNAIDHTTLKIYPVGYEDHGGDPWTRMYMHDCPDCTTLLTPTTRVSRVSFKNNVNTVALWCQANPQLTTLDISGSTAMTQLICNGSNLKSLNMKGVFLNDLRVFGNELSTIDLSEVNPGFVIIQVFDNKLTTVNVTASANAEAFQVHENLLTSLNITSSGVGPHGPTKILCYTNLLPTLDVRMCEKLDTLTCHANLLTSLYISGTTLLSSIDCHDNKLSEESVDNILTALTQSGMADVGTLDLTGGTNAAPSIVGTTAITYLTTGPKSWTITTN